jgi:hypothetical protein
MQAPYTTVQSVFLTLGVEVPSESSDLYIQTEQLILAMSRTIDRRANRRIYSEDDEETYLYDGDGSDLLVISDVIDPTVTVDGVAVEVAQYPANKGYTSRIVLTDGHRFTKGRQNVAVTGLQAMNLYLPDDIQFACTALVAGVMSGILPAPSGLVVSETIGNFQTTYKVTGELVTLDKAKRDVAQVDNIINSYRRVAL